MAVPPSQISAVEGKAAQEPMHMVNGHEHCEATQEGQGWGEDWCAASPAASCALEPKDRSFRGDLVTGPQSQVSWQQRSWLHVSRVTIGPPVPQGPESSRSCRLLQPITDHAPLQPHSTPRRCSSFWPLSILFPLPRTFLLSMPALCLVTFPIFVFQLRRGLLQEAFLNYTADPGSGTTSGSQH